MQLERFYSSRTSRSGFLNGAHDDQVDAMTQALLRWNMVPRQPVVYFDEYEFERQTRISPY